MRPIRIKNGTVITPGALLKDADVLTKGARIAAVGDGRVLSRKGCLEVNAEKLFVAPGFIDTHIHGDPARVLANEVKYGTTAVVLALSCDRLDRVYSKACEISKFIKTEPFGKAILGVRLEGPYINKRRAGAQDKRYIKSASVKELSQIIERCGSVLKMMTIAPEVKGAKPLIKLLSKRGMIASIGHSDAAYEEALEGIDLGITHATHLFNAMSGFDNCERGVATAALLDERVFTEVILDLIHFHPKLFRLLLKVKDINKIILITDSVHSEIRKGIRKAGGVYRFGSGRIAGSCLTMIGAVKNAVRAGGLSLVDAVRLATQNPAKVLGVGDRKGSLAVGKDADIVIFDERFDVKMTVVGGEVVYGKMRQRCAG